MKKIVFIILIIFTISFGTQIIYNLTRKNLDDEFASQIKKSIQIKNNNKVKEVSQIENNNKVKEVSQIENNNQVKEVKQIENNNQVKEVKQVESNNQVKEVSQIENNNQVKGVSQIKNNNQVKEVKQVENNSPVKEGSQIGNNSYAKKGRQVENNSQKKEIKKDFDKYIWDYGYMDAFGAESTPNKGENSSKQPEVSIKKEVNSLKSFRIFLLYKGKNGVENTGIRAVNEEKDIKNMNLNKIIKKTQFSSNKYVTVKKVLSKVIRIHSII